jgi:unsaturated chondroitin disaccharide hydrolase
MELLFYVASITGNQTLHGIAESHVTKVLHDHVRSDWSSYHVVVYAANGTGVLWKQTAQGYANESTWARGQSWGVYGFTKAANWTGRPEFLNAAVNMGEFFLNHLKPGIGLPPW